MAQRLYKGERDGSPGVGYDKGQLGDQLYHAVLAHHNPVWRYVVDHYKDESNTPLVVLGYDSIPLAIELSQWTYPVSFITDTYEGVKKATRDCEIQAGFFKDFFYFNFRGNIPRGRVAVFLWLLDHLTDEQIPDYIDLLLRRVTKIVCGCKDNRDWRSILHGRYNYKVTPYGKDNLLIVIEEKYD